MLREIISRCKTIKYCADNFTQDFGLDYVVVQNKNNWVKGDGVFMANGNLSEEKIRIIVNTLESKKLMPSSHLYKR